MFDVTPENRAVFEARLTEAEAAWHEIQLGQSARVFVDQNGERVEYAMANSTKLRAYIYDLRKALGKSINVGGPMTFGMLP